MIPFRKAAFLLCLLFFIHPALPAQKPGRLDLPELDLYIDNARQAWMVPGLSIAIVKNDSVVFSRGYGLRQYGKNDPVDENSVFAIASNTKSFTVAALAILNDEGKLDWDDRVIQYLPWFSLYDPFVSNEMRIRDLLCHRSGLKTFSGDLLWYETNYTREEVIQRARFLEPAYGFRYRYGYSNIMFLAAGQIIPEVTGSTWDEFIRERLLNPLGMSNTYITLENTLTASNLARPHHVDMLACSTEVLPYMNWANIAPAGALNSSASDMAKWIRFQLNLGQWEGKQLISGEALWETREMHTIQPVESYSPNIWASMHFEGYGLGWQLYDYHGCKIIGHGGGSDGMISRIILVPEEDLGFVILTNSINTLPMSLVFYILDKYFTGKSRDWSALIHASSIQGLKQEKEKWDAYKSSADAGLKPSVKLKNYCGTYGGELYGNAEVLLEKGQLVLDFLPSSTMIGDLSTLEGDTFLIRLRDNPSLPEGTVRFYLDGNREVEKLVVDIPNPDFDFTELKFNKMEK